MTRSRRNERARRRARDTFRTFERDRAFLEKLLTPKPVDVDRQTPEAWRAVWEEP
jgi:hypothetical protein